MHWILQHNLYHENGMVELLDILERAKIPHSQHKVIPFIGELENEEDVNPTGPVMVMGSYAMRHVAKRKGWTPGVFDLESFTYDKQINTWPNHMLNEDTVVCQFVDVIDKMPAYKVFMRPVSDNKFFAGGVFYRENLESWVDSVCHIGENYGDSLHWTTPVMMSSVKDIKAEYRNWIFNGKVITSSLYKRGDKVYYSDQVDQAIIDYANERASQGGPPDRLAYVMDVADTDIGLKIVECNTFNASGLYAANVGKIVAALEDYYN